MSKFLTCDTCKEDYFWNHKHECKVPAKEIDNLKRQRNTLLRHVGRMVKNHEETISILLDMKSENLIKLLELKTDLVKEDLHKLNDGEYISRSSLLDTLKDVIELLKDHE